MFSQVFLLWIREQSREGQEFWPELLEGWSCFQRDEEDLGWGAALGERGVWFEMRVIAFRVELMGRQLDI